jgi:hypothetical protein
MERLIRIIKPKQKPYNLGSVDFKITAPATEQILNNFI